jgi:predicted permease
MRFYRTLLYLYPRYFRNEYRHELIRAFGAKAAGRRAPLVWLLALADVVPSALAVRWDHLRQDTAAAMTQPTLGVDVRLAFRQMAKAPLFSAVVIAVLGLGIGLNSGLLTLLGAYAWRPAPGITRDVRLARLVVQASDGEDRSLHDSWLSRPDLEALRARRDVFAAVAAWQSVNLSADFGQGPELVEGQYVTGNYFAMLGVRMAAGSGVLADDDPALAQSVVIDHSLWLTFFNGSDTAIGATIRILNQPFTVVGVTPPLFSGVDVLDQTDYLIWLPLSARTILAPGGPGLGARGHEPFLQAAAQLADGVRPAQVERRLAPLAAQLARVRSDSANSRVVIGAERLTGMPATDSGTRELIAAILVMAAMGVLITCTNVGALLLGRAVSRRREIGVRLSLGATRLRLVRQLLTESLVYALLGATLGIMLFALVSLVLPKIAQQMPQIGLTPEPATFGYAALLALVTTVAMGLVPALHATRADIGEVIKGSAQLAVRRSRLQAAFVIAQLASSMPVLIVTALMLASMSRMASGGDVPAPRTIVSMLALIVRPSGPDSGADVASIERVVTRLAMEPGVSAAAASIKTGQTANVQYTYVTSSYFAAREMRLLRGRAPAPAEAGQPVAVISELAARRLWPGENPLGQRIDRPATWYAGAQSFEVIGVAAPAAHDLADPQVEVFAPLAFAPYAYFGPRLTIRTASDARTMVPRLRRAIAEAEPYAALTQILTIAENAEERMLDAQRTSIGAFVIGFAALLLASLGLYAIIAFSVAQRTREIGVRLAIGAAPATVVGEFFRSGMKVSLIGLLIGMPIAILGVKMVEANMLGFTFRDVFAVAVIVPILLGVAALASWLPARRAGRVDPLIALQAE